VARERGITLRRTASLNDEPRVLLDPRRRRRGAIGVTHVVVVGGGIAGLSAPRAHGRGRRTHARDAVGHPSWRPADLRRQACGAHRWEDAPSTSGPTASARRTRGGGARRRAGRGIRARHPSCDRRVGPFGGPAAPAPRGLALACRHVCGASEAIGMLGVRGGAAARRWTSSRHSPHAAPPLPDRAIGPLVAGQAWDGASWTCSSTRSSGASTRAGSATCPPPRSFPPLLDAGQGAEASCARSSRPPPAVRRTVLRS